MVEAAGLVGDHAGEDVEPAGRAFRIGGGGDVVGQGQALDQRHDIDAARFEHGAIAQRNLMQLEFVDALGNRRVRTWQKTRAHAVSHFTEAQIETCRLDLIGDEVVGA